STSLWHAVQPTDFTMISPLIASPLSAGGAGSGSFSDRLQTYFTSAATIVSSTGDRLTPFTSTTGYGFLFTSTRVFDWLKKCGIRVVERKSRGASTHFAAQSSVTLDAIRRSGGPGRRFLRFASTATLFTSLGRIWYVSM